MAKKEASLTEKNSKNFAKYLIKLGIVRLGFKGLLFFKSFNFMFFVFIIYLLWRVFFTVIKSNKY